MALNIQKISEALLDSFIAADGASKVETESSEASELKKDSSVDSYVGQGDSLGSFKFTFYWVARESDYIGPRNTPIFSRSGKELARARRGFVSAASMEGTGILENGEMVNLFGPCKKGTCFLKVDRKKFPYGMGSQSNRINPFRSVAADGKVLKHGTKLYVKELDGVEIAGVDGFDDFVHDGCVVVEDTGVTGQHLDMFVPRQNVYPRVFAAMGQKESVDVYTGVSKCN